MKNIVFTSTMSSEMAKWLAEFAKKHKMKKRDVLEKALENFKTEVTKGEFREGFKKSSEDRSTKGLSGAGVADYMSHLSRLP